MNQVWFENKRSYDEWDLFLADVSIEAPEPKRTTIEVPGKDGVLDMTHSFGDRIRYGERQITLTFHIKDYKQGWQWRFSEIYTAINGRRLRVVIEPDIDWYWDCYCKVENAESSGNHAEVVIRCMAYPYKYRVNETAYIIQATASGTGVICKNKYMQVIPTFTASENITIEYGDVTKSMGAGTKQFGEIVFEEGDNMIRIKGSGTVKIAYREGML